jgi:hypothetical protein
MSDIWISATLCFFNHHKTNTFSLFGFIIAITKHELECWAMIWLPGLTFAMRARRFYTGSSSLLEKIMQSEDRIIHFSTELIHAPVQHKVPALQKLYYELSQTRAAYDSSDFSTPPQFRFYSRRAKNTQSVLAFLPDRVALVEEWADIALSDFEEKVREVGKRVFDAFNLPGCLAQTATIRTTFALTHFDDARVFLMDHACNQANRISPHFRRPILTGGIRFILPETPENPGTLHVIVESFRHSTKEVFVEVKGVFGNQHISGDSLEGAISNIRIVRSFITDSLFPYLDQFDHPVDEA